MASKVSNAGRKPIYKEPRTKVNFFLDVQVYDKMKKLAEMKGITITEYIVSGLKDRVEFDYFQELKKIKKS